MFLRFLLVQCIVMGFVINKRHCQWSQTPEQNISLLLPSNKFRAQFSLSTASFLATGAGHDFYWNKPFAFRMQMSIQDNLIKNSNDFFPLLFASAWHDLMSDSSEHQSFSRCMAAAKDSSSIPGTVYLLLDDFIFFFYNSKNVNHFFQDDVPLLLSYYFLKYSCWLPSIIIKSPLSLYKIFL